MQRLSNSPRVDIETFLDNGFSVRDHLAEYLQLTLEQVDQRLPDGKDDLAALHPGAFQADQATEFYETTVERGISLNWRLGISAAPTTSRTRFVCRRISLEAQSLILEEG